MRSSVTMMALGIFSIKDLASARAFQPVASQVGPKVLFDNVAVEELLRIMDLCFPGEINPLILRIGFESLTDESINLNLQFTYDCDERLDCVLFEDRIRVIAATEHAESLNGVMATFGTFDRGTGFRFTGPLFESRKKRLETSSPTE
ncbi:hypothetical protein [Schlesneria paludicola]|uniref:hypothetical protein n=1 Tax=Schlesneria paludicola TaxID=360056 RepID=UPI0002EA81BD|nr:hypothetical protein [Schlesneria paludicola]